MLGEGDSDIYDSCRDLGCDALRGVTPRMALRGNLHASFERSTLNLIQVA